MSKFCVTLDDKYTLQEGRIYLTGLQALVRLLLMQRWADQSHGFNTAGFLSGYRGSPLAGIDLEAWRAAKYLEENRVIFRPAINEDLGATAVWGSQQASLFPGATVQGVYGMWYGKGPGVDRSLDAIKHANHAGTSRLGGVLALMGDDHACKSSTLPHQSDMAMMSAFVPILNPSSVQDVLDLGLYGWAMSRASGLWTGFKMVSDTAETAASVTVGSERFHLLPPERYGGETASLSIRWPDQPAVQEERLHTERLPLVQRFAYAHRLDKILWAPKKARVGIVVTGKSTIDTLQALSDLGIDNKLGRDLGIRVYKVALTWPLEPERLKEFAEDLEEIIVVEEKQPLIENQIKTLLYAYPESQRPQVVGKTDERGRPLLPVTYELDSLQIATALGQRFQKLGIPLEKRSASQLNSLQQRQAELQEKNVRLERSPFYCSGCPHNTSTRVIEGSRALAGIGCHYMATWVESERTKTVSHMGGEGAGWIGQSPFREEPHIFANMGDGTYYHSGLMAIRACVAENVNITYKILYNDAVAMTGGQPVEGGLTVPQITQQVAAEGVKKIVVVTDDPEKYPVGAGFASDVKIYDRSELEWVQQTLREWPGVSALIYDQTCAAELRRRRKRGMAEDPPVRAFIHKDVCEGCGHCSEKSHCLSVTPVETAFGEKRAIDQSSCNKDFSCVDGFCPSFVSLEGAVLKTPSPEPSLFDHALPTPKQPPLETPYPIYITGIGGTGIVTVGALLGMAAHLEGKGCTVVDQVGLAQKGGAVVCQLTIGKGPEQLKSARIGTGQTRLLLGCDLVVSAYPDTLRTLLPKTTKAIINQNQAITGEFTKGGTYDFKTKTLLQDLKAYVDPDDLDLVPAGEVAKALLGDTISTNIFMMGYSLQKGLVPVSLEAVEEAIRLNNVAVEQNLQALYLGRLMAHEPELVQKAALKEKPLEEPIPKGLEELISHRMLHLSAYQDIDLAHTFEAFIRRVQYREAEVCPGRESLTQAVAVNLAKFMMVKDEYEVGRLYTDGRLEEQLKAQFEKWDRMHLYLSPPILAPKDPHTGKPIKIKVGAWALRVFRLLARFKSIRGKWYDPFSYLGERKHERQLLAQYQDLLSEILPGLTAENHAIAVKLARLPDEIRGYGYIKEGKAVTAEKQKQKLLAQFWEKASGNTLSGTNG